MAVVDSFLQALHQLESSLDIGSAVRQVVEGGGGRWMGQYMIKRKYSEGSHHVFGIVVPDLRPHEEDVPRPHEEDKMPPHPASERSEGVCHSSPGDTGFSHQEPLNVGSTAASKTDVSGNSRGSSKTAQQASDSADPDTAATGADADPPNTISNSSAQTGPAQHQTHWPKLLANLLGKGQALMATLVPSKLAQLRPVAKLLGTSGSSSSSSGSSSSSVSQLGTCANRDTSTASADSAKLRDTACKPASTKASDREQGTSAVGTGAFSEDFQAVVESQVLPDINSGEAVNTDIFMPVELESSADTQGHASHVGTSHAARESMRVFAASELSAELASLLDATADRLLKESCGEGWLLQPRIADMTRLEYRVHLLNGAQAVRCACQLSDYEHMH